MAKEVYVEVANKAKNSKKGHIGVEDISRKILKGYIGDDDGIARMFFQGGKIILPPSVGETSFSGSSLIYSGWDPDDDGNKLTCKRLGNFLFISSNVFKYGYLKGLYVINMETHIVKQITNSGADYIHGLELKENRFLISNGNVSFLYNGETETATQLSIGGGWNHKVELGDKVIIRSQNNTVDLYLYNQKTERFTSLGLPLHDIKSTSQGIFAYASFGTSTSYPRYLRFNPSSETFTEITVLNYNEDGTTTVYNVTANVYISMFEDKYGTLWATGQGWTNAQYYDGKQFIAKSLADLPTACFYGLTIKRIGSNDYFWAATGMYRFAGSSIEKVANITVNTYDVSNWQISCGCEQDGALFIHYWLRWNASHYGFVSKIKDGEVTDLTGRLLNNTGATGYAEIDGVFYFSTAGEIHKVEDGIFTTIASNGFFIDRFFKLGDLFFMTDSSKLYEYKDGVIKTLVTKSGGDSMSVVQAGSFINVIGYYKTYDSYYNINISSYSDVSIRTYNLITGEVKTLSTKVRYRLGQTAYVGYSARKVYDMFGNAVNSYSFDINTVTDYLTRGASATNWSNHNILAYIGGSELSFLYEVPRRMGI